MSRGQTSSSWEKPEDRELEKKRFELADLEGELAQRELELVTRQAELRVFEARYLRIVGVRYAELDEIEAQSDEAQARLHPKNRKAQEQAAHARAQAQESAQAVADAHQPGQKTTFEPSERLRKLYRDVAKSVHPDFAVDEEERGVRTQLMAEANRAYKEGDERRLQAILHEWENSPEAVKGEGPIPELIRIIRKIAQVEDRLRVIEAEIAQLNESDLYQLKTRAETAEKEGRDLLAEMATRLDSEIAVARERLKILTTIRTNA